MKAHKVRTRLIALLLRMRQIRKAREKMSYQDILNLQKRKLKNLVEHAVRNSPLYRDLYKNIDPDNFELEALPPISKSDIMARFDDSLCVRDITFDEIREFIADKSRVGELYKGKYVITHTSGTTGKPGIFVFSESDWHEGGALTAVKPGPLKLDWSIILSLPIRPFFRFRFAAVIATRGHLASYIVFLSAPSIRKLFVDMRALDILTPFDEILSFLNEYKPQFLHSYPTFLSELARAKLCGKIDLDLKIVNTSSEYFDPLQQALFRKAFPNTVIEEVYGTTECMPMARRCGNGKLHVISEACIIEPVDESNNPVDFGQISHHILMTNLFNYTQPLIRYEVPDSVKLLPPSECSCGSPLPVIEVFGRTNDILRLPKRDGTEVRVLPVHAYLGVYGIDGIERYQVIHRSPKLVEVKFVCRENADASEIKRKIEAGLSKVFSELGADVEVRAELAEVERDPNTGKFKQFVEQANTFD